MQPESFVAVQQSGPMAEWRLMVPRAIKRLNIVDGAAVNPNVLETSTFLGEVPYVFLMQLQDEDEFACGRWMWTLMGLACPEWVRLYEVKVRQDLRRVSQHAEHHEVWIMGLFKAEDGVSRLVPLKQDSDFDKGKIPGLGGKWDLDAGNS